MSRNSKVRRWPRFVGSLSVECRFCKPGERYERRLAGETLNVGAGGVALLLNEILPLGIPVLLNFCQEEPLRGHVVWTDQRTRTVLADGAENCETRSKFRCAMLHRLLSPDVEL